MKKIFLFFSIASLCMFVIHSYAQNTFPATGPVGIGTTSPVASSLLDMRSTTRGLLTPRMTLAQRNLIGAPAVGLLIYQTDGTTGFYYYFGSGWIRLVTAAAANNLSNLSTVVAANRSISPATNGTFDLGTAALRWRNAYLSGSLTVNSTTGIGVSSYGSNYGLYGYGPYIGVYGTGTSYGVYGYSQDGYGTTGASSSSFGVYGSSSSNTGVYGTSNSGNGVYGYSNGAYGVYGQSTYLGVYGVGTSYGVYGYSANNYGVYGTSGYLGVYGNGTTYGTYGYSGGGTGAAGVSSTGTAVYGSSSSGLGASFYSGSYWALRAQTTTGTYAAVFYGLTYSSGGYTSSDKNLKKNVQEFTDGMSIINKLKPKYYEFKDDAKYAFLNLPKGNHYGLMAQDVEQVLPNLVKESPHESVNSADAAINISSADGKPASAAEIAEQKIKSTPKESISIKAVNYTELIPIIIKAMQELSAKNDELQVQVNELKSIISKAGYAAALNASSGYIKQNIPNPANNSTIISYYLPDNITGKSQIMITDIKGSLLKVYNAAKGAGQINIKTGELPAGTYNYSLYVNDKRIDSKQMVIIK